MENKTILIVDDTVTNLDILVDLLDMYDVIDATSGVDALEIVEEEEIDLILLDIMMPQMDGYEVCQKLKQNPKTKDIPVIFITAKTDEQSIERAYDIGGADYVTKPFLPKELLARVKKEIHIQTLMQELKRLASIDPLTKLYNRRYFSTISQQILDLAKRHDEPISLIMLDIDNFKVINDTYGHQVGDDVIVALAHELYNIQRKSDIICRYGGEEFVVLLPKTSLKKAKMVAEKVRKNIASLQIKGDVNFTVSLGVAEVDVSNESNIEKALKRSDDALYEAKHRGKNQVCST